MRIVFSSVFKRDLLEAETKYSAISSKLGDDFHERAKEAVRTITLRRVATMWARMASDAGSAARFPI